VTRSKTLFAASLLDRFYITSLPSLLLSFTMPKQYTKKNSTKKQREMAQLNSLMAKVGMSKTHARVQRVASKAHQVAKVARPLMSIARNADPAHQFVRNLVDGGNPNKPKVGCPFNTTPPSVKARYQTTVDAAVGTDGIGFIAITPVTCNNGVVCMAYTDATYARNTFDTTAGTGMHRVVPTSLPYSSTDLSGDNVEARVCCCGVRAEYSGTLLNRGGSIYAYRDPANEAVAFDGSTQNISSLTQRRNVGTTTNNGQVITASAVPIAPGQFAYAESLTPYSEAQNQFPTIIVFTGAVGNTVRCTFVMDIEYTGPSVETISTSNTPSTVTPSLAMAAASKHHDGLMQKISGGLKVAGAVVKAGQQAAPIIGALAAFL
jgi:hypothetical protein